MLVVSGVTLSPIVVISEWVTKVAMQSYLEIDMIAMGMQLVIFGLQKLWIFNQ